MLIKLTIDRFEEETTVLKSETGESIVWPKNMLPAGTHEGSVLEFEIKDDNSAEAEKKELAKHILNEILDVKD